jgi:hypothetical protein
MHRSEGVRGHKEEVGNTNTHDLDTFSSLFGPATPRQSDHHDRDVLDFVKGLPRQG